MLVNTISQIIYGKPLSYPDSGWWGVSSNSQWGSSRHALPSTYTWVATLRCGSRGLRTGPRTHDVCNHLAARTQPCVWYSKTGTSGLGRWEAVSDLKTHSDWLVSCRQGHIVVLFKFGFVTETNIVWDEQYVCEWTGNLKPYLFGLKMVTLINLSVSKQSSFSVVSSQARQLKLSSKITCSIWAATTWSSNLILNFSSMNVSSTRIGSHLSLTPFTTGTRLCQMYFTSKMKSTITSSFFSTRRWWLTMASTAWLSHSLNR